MSDTPIEELPVPQGTPMFHLHRDDLEEMERIVPELYQRFCADCQTKQRTQFSKLKDILSNIRWDYGPYKEIERIDA